jgi:hypothetical protein
MGCEHSSAASQAMEVKPKFAVEKYKEPRHPNLLQQSRQMKQMHKIRRKPVLKVPERVIAPSTILTDVGCHAYKSMQSSPTVSFSVSRGRRECVIDDIDEPPNHETYRDYITHLDSFMWDLRLHPERLQKRVAELRTKMDIYSDDEKYCDIPFERY